MEREVWRSGRPPATIAQRWVARAPGVAAAAGIAAIATVLGEFVPVVGAPVLAVVAGITIRSQLPQAQSLRPGLAFTSTRVLQASIVVLGTGLSLGQVVSTGESSMPVLVGTLLIALGVAWSVGRAMHLRPDLNILIGVGTAICGASAIAATDAVIDADETDVSYAIATIFTFNVVAVLTYPTVGHLLGLSQHAFGLWAGTAINDTSSVVAASTIYGHAAVAYGAVVKLTRTLAIVPLCLGLAAWRNRAATKSALVSQRVANAGVQPPNGLRTSARRYGFDLRQAIPTFIVGFLVAVSLNTVGLVPPAWHHALADLASWMITAALAAIGLSANVSHIRSAGPRPLLFGALLWGAVGIASLALQLATGTT
jgi:uncharacterized integral membrane protein (TIGR00698 family)